MTYRIETRHDGNWEPEPNGECASIADGERYIAALRRDVPEYAHAEMRVAEDTAQDEESA